MATYRELLQLYNERVLKQQVTVAVADAADDILSEDPLTENHAERYAWAANALNNPGREADRMLIAVLVKNKTATVAQIRSVETNDLDNQVLTNVQSLVNLFALSDATA